MQKIAVSSFAIVSVATLLGCKNSSGGADDFSGASASVSATESDTQAGTSDDDDDVTASATATVTATASASDTNGDSSSGGADASATTTATDATSVTATDGSSTTSSTSAGSSGSGGSTDSDSDSDGATLMAPDAIPDLTLWLRADLGVTADISNLVSAWADQSGAGNNAGQATGLSQPTLVADGGVALNNMPVVRFDNGQFMTGASTTNLVDGDGYTMAVVAVVDDIDTTHSNPYYNDAIFGDDGGNIGIHVDSAVPTIMGYHWHAPSAYYATRPIVLDTLVACIVWYDGSSIFTDIGAGPASLASLVYDNPSTSWVIGASYMYDYFDGDLAETIIYDRSLSANERASLRLYLEDRYLN